MFRIALLLLLNAVAGAATEEPQRPSPAAPARPSAVVWYAHEPSAIARYDASATVAARMVEGLVESVTGEREIGAAWRRLVGPKDRIGIKVSAVGGRHFSTRVEVVEALLATLESAGMPRSSVLVWDRDSADLRAAGFDARRLGCKVRGINPPGGWDRAAPFAAPTLGKLIWGDLLFSEKARKRLGKTPPERDQLSSTSHLATIITRELDKIINVPVLSDSATIGVSGAIYNITVPNVDNWRRFVSAETNAAESLPELCADERLASKVVLHLMDGLTAQYAGGPEGNGNYAFPHATLYASRDPVALDATALRKIEGWRREGKLPPIGRRASWLEAAAKAGLGAFDEAAIDLRRVTSR